MNGQLKDISEFLDHPKLVILVVNQHNNITHLHPKAISMPRGMLFQSAKEIWAQGHSALRTDRKISTLMLTASSNWGPRPYIVGKSSRCCCCCCCCVDRLYWYMGIPVLLCMGMCMHIYLSPYPPSYICVILVHFFFMHRMC